MTSLVDELDVISKRGYLQKVVPDSVSENLNEEFIELREYQIVYSDDFAHLIRFNLPT